MTGRYEVVREGSPPDEPGPNGSLKRTPSGHIYEMGTRHDCGVDDCPANTGGKR